MTMDVRQFSRRGGKARAKKLSKERRSQIARLGGLTKAARSKKPTQR